MADEAIRELRKGSVIKLTDYVCNTIGDKKVIVILGMKMADKHHFYLIENEVVLSDPLPSDYQARIRMTVPATGNDVPLLTDRAVSSIIGGEADFKPLVQVLEIGCAKKPGIAGSWVRLLISDSVSSQQAVVIVILNARIVKTVCEIIGNPRALGSPRRTLVLPDDLLEDVIIRSSNVGNCERVHQSWSNIIRDPSFVQRHLHYQRIQYQHRLSKEHSRIGCVVAVTDSDAAFDFTLFYMEYSHYRGIREMEARRIDHPMFDIGFPELFGLVGSCNGLLCMTKKISKPKEYLYIFNPLRREYLSLPSYSSDVADMTELEGFPIDYIAYGFGYVADCDVYKAVRVVYVQDFRYSIIHRVRRHPAIVQVYTLGGGVGWRTVRVIPDRIESESVSGLFVNGAVYWIDTDGKVLALSLADEQMCYLPPVPYPDPPPYDIQQRQPRQYLQRKLVLLGDWVSIACSFTGSDSTEIWSLKKEAEGASWSRQFNIAGHGHCFTFLALSNAEELVCFCSDGDVCVYNRDSEVVISFHRAFSPFLVHVGILHVDSFLALRELGDQEEDVKQVGQE
ncbi:hypothetical protein MKW98_013677 [Papaver atlanticum]|uniref:F-box associated beta-propeller type 1 domain-containing protein n=1 Tax=Papaver atlanticum TaxID=357466 RepID=A0AAD4S787_9MAGN|nr:hypothetical protein MKW98_013677 [Papaver atlanticum]